MCRQKPYAPSLATNPRERSVAGQSASGVSMWRAALLRRSTTGWRELGKELIGLVCKSFGATSQPYLEFAVWN